MIELSNGADYTKKQKKLKVHKFLILSSLVCFFALLGFAAYEVHAFDELGVTVNGVHIKLHEISEYKSFIEPTLKPVVFTENNDELIEGFTCKITDTFDFSKDIIGKDVDLNYEYSFDESILRKNLEKLNESKTESSDAYIDSELKEVVPEIYGTKFDVDAVIAAIDGESVIDFSDYCIKPNRVSSDLESFVDDYNNWSDWNVCYLDSDINVVVPDGVLLIDENGSISISSTSFLNDYADIITERYNTKGKNYAFTTSNGDDIEVAGGTLGSIVDTDKELEELKQLFLSNTSVKDKEPNYKIHRELGDEYIEVSIDDQHVWYYKNGEILWESDCVTGCVSKKNDTPKGAWYLDIVENDRMLRPKGSDPVHVDKWMRFTQDGCGLHDAPWRYKFGGSIYKTSGSHGCVNLPKQKAFELFEYAYIGLPVLVY